MTLFAFIIFSEKFQLKLMSGKFLATMISCNGLYNTI